MFKMYQRVNEEPTFVPKNYKKKYDKPCIPETIEYDVEMIHEGTGIEPENHPLVFNCAIGKDRTGILAAILLSVLGVKDEDIIEDYSLSTPYMEELLERIRSDPEIARAIEPLPAYFWEAAPESMSLFLSTLRREYGSMRDYLKAQGAESSLIQSLESALLT